jgi:integrase
MARIIRRVWKSRGPLGERVRHVAYGYTLMGPNGRERKASSDWLTEQDALTALTARLQAIEAGEPGRPAERTFAQVAAEYLVYKAEKRSVGSDKRILEGRLLPAFGRDVNVRRLTAAAVAQYERRRLGQVSAYTVANELSVLRHLLRLAKRWGYVAAVPEITLPKKPEGRLRYLEADELARLLDACRASRNPYLATIVTLAVHTGMRKGEILGLEWARVDLSSARLTLYRTKSGKPRGVPMNGVVYDALIALEPDPVRRTGLLFRKSDDRAWGQIRRAFESALTKAGIKAFRFHDLRHTAASHLIMRGASLRDVQEILGHADLKMTQRYAHLSPAHLRGAVERLEGLAMTGAVGAHALPGGRAEAANSHA